MHGGLGFRAWGLGILKIMGLGTGPCIEMLVLISTQILNPKPLTLPE